MPAFETYDKLRTYLLKAIQECSRIWICLVKLKFIAALILSLLNILGYIQKLLAGTVHAML